ncbi:putative DUF4340 domain-containing protein [Gammaproteobacteria bacterium]
MNRLISVLGVVLAIQLVLALFLEMTAGGIGGVASSEPLLHFEAKSIDRITIEPSGKAPMVLEHRGTAWSLPALAGFPAFTAKVDGFLNRLAGLHKRLPVATTSAAVKRFKVSSAAYEHKVVLSAGDKTVATLWLGDSPGFRQLYGRANDEDAVYNLDLATYEVAADPNQWTDKTVLNLKPDEITQVNLPEVHLVRVKEAEKGNNAEKANDKDGNNDAGKPGKWQVEGLSPREAINFGEIETLVNQLANIGFESVLGKENQPEYRQEAPALTVSITTQAGEQRSYVFSKPDSGKEAKPEKATDANKADADKGKGQEKGSEYILKASISPYYFKVADFTVKELLEAKRDKLVKKPTAAATPKEVAKETAPVASVPAASPPAP